jgi:APA family basic amino acid/polyamine antiporter
MSWKNIFAKKDLELLLSEMAGEHRLHRVLGPISLTALGVGCIIGAGIFALTGVAAANYAGPSIIVSFAIAGLGCAFAALCYAEFAAMAPVAGSVYTYAYTTLGEIFAWIIGWDLILEYSMGCATVASAWAHYLNKLLAALFHWTLPNAICYDPITNIEGTTTHAWFNLPAVLIMILVTTVLVIGIKESARTNAVLVLIKIAVVFFVIFAGWSYTQSKNWNSIPVTDRVLPQERVIPDLVKEYYKVEAPGKEKEEKSLTLQKQLAASYRWEWLQNETKRLKDSGNMTAAQAEEIIASGKKKIEPNLPTDAAAVATVEKLMPKLREEGEKEAGSHWGLLGEVGLNRWLTPIDDATRSPFAPYGLSGIMLGASIVFFAFIGFDSISTHAEEAKKPQRDVPIGIIVSLVLCTVLYIAVAAVITGMVPYPKININAPIAAAFTDRAAIEDSQSLRVSGALIAVGGLAGMTSVLLVLFLSQARVFMAMARDGLLPKVFGTIHPKYRTPHIATMLTGTVICLVAALTPIEELAKMVNIGTLMAFVMVCASVMILRVRRPDIKRPFRCPLIYFVAPAGIVVNLTLMLFLPIGTWWRLGIWLVIGMVVYFLYSRRHSHLAKHLLREIKTPLVVDDDSE